MSPTDLKFLYFTPADIQVARVDRQCIVNFCEAVQRLGVDVELVTIGITLLDVEKRGEHPLDLYRIRDRFPVRTIRIPARQDSPGWWVALNRLWVDIIESFRATGRNSATAVLYTKNYSPALAFLALRAIRGRRASVFFEAHMPPRSPLQRYVLRNANGVIANSGALAGDLVAGGLPADRVIATHQGVDLDLVDEFRVPAREARIRLGLPPDRQLVIYTGKIHWGYREVDYLIEAARKLPDGIEMIMVGGREDHNIRYREFLAAEGITNVTFTGFIAPNLVQYYQFAADVLLLYYPSGIALNRYRSPGKLFEYMAAGRPVIAADLPVLREVLGDDDPIAVLVPQDSPDLLANAIINLLADPRKREDLAARGLKRVADFTWMERGKKIMSFIERRLAARK
ncbi:MAG: glycosyltransferase [Candidatus Kapaibacterium sp.]